MSLSYSDARSKPRSYIANAWMALNGAIAGGMAFYWSGLSGLIGEPFKWAMREGVSFQPSLFEYPYIVLWSTPALCMLSGWLAAKSGQHALARIVGCYPSMVLALMLGWYYLAPSHWL